MAVPAHQTTKTESASDGDLYRHVGQRIKHRRKALNISQSQIAQRMNLSYQQIQKYESGLCQILLGRILEFSDILNVPPEYFYQGLARNMLGRVADDNKISSECRAPVDILIVGGDRIELSLLEDALRRFKRQVTLKTALNAESAVDFFRSSAIKRPDLTIIHLQADAEPGLRLVRQIKSNSQTASIPVAVMTYMPDKTAMLESYKLGAAAFILKPADQERLRETTRGFLQYWLETIVLP
jgi:transcriptional regulator with XRE-family HTH domain